VEEEPRVLAKRRNQLKQLDSGLLAVNYCMLLYALPYGGGGAYPIWLAG